MNPSFLLIIPIFLFFKGNSQPIKPCALNNVYRQFDFLIGDWDVFAKNGNIAGESHIALILDSCVIIENWKSAGNYAGKSLNTYNSSLNKWQQTWVDDKGTLTEYFGSLENSVMVLVTRPYFFNVDTLAIKRMRSFPLSANNVRQLGEISKDGGNSWVTEFDLEYRRRL